ALSSPAQVVRRQAQVSVPELVLDPGIGPIEQQLRERYSPRHHRIDLAEPPLMRFLIAFDAEQKRWLLLQMLHHLIGDQATAEVRQREARAFIEGRGDTLPPPT